MSEWQPIETAPRDKTCILVYRPTAKGQYIPKVGEDYFDPKYFGGKWMRSNEDSQPTLWQPLPGATQMTDPFELKAPMVTALSANVYADGVRISFGENIADTREATYHTAVFIPASLFAEFRKMVTSMEPKLTEMKNAVQN